MYTVQFLPYTPLSGTAGPYNTVYSYLLHHPLTEDRHILEPDLQLRMNESGSFTFTVTQKHPYYARMLQDPLWDAAVYRDGKFLWAGHPLIQDIDIYGNVTFQCEGVLGYLADNYIGTFSDRKTPGGWLYTFLAQARYQQFLAGEIWRSTAPSGRTVPAILTTPGLWNRTAAAAMCILRARTACGAIPKHLCRP